MRKKIFDTIFIIAMLWSITFLILVKWQQYSAPEGTCPVITYYNELIIGIVLLLISFILSFFETHKKH